MGRTEKHIVTASEHQRDCFTGQSHDPRIASDEADYQNESVDSVGASRMNQMTVEAEEARRQSRLSAAGETIEEELNEAQPSVIPPFTVGSGFGSGISWEGDMADNQENLTAGQMYSNSPSMISSHTIGTSSLKLPGLQHSTSSIPSTSYYRTMLSSAPSPVSSSYAYYPPSSLIPTYQSLPSVSSTVYSPTSSGWLPTVGSLSHRHISPISSSVVYSRGPATTTSTTYVSGLPTTTTYYGGSSYRYYTPPRTYPIIHSSSGITGSSYYPSTVYRSITPPVYRRQVTPTTTTTVYSSAPIVTTHPGVVTQSRSFSSYPHTRKSTSFSLGASYPATPVLASTPLTRGLSGVTKISVSSPLHAPAIRKLSTVSTRSFR